MFYIAYTIRDGNPSWVVAEEATGLVDKVFGYEDKDAADSYLAEKLLSISKPVTTESIDLVKQEETPDISQPVVQQKAKRGRKPKA